MTTYLPRQSSVDLDSADRPFDNIINFRDVGRSINQLMGSRILKEGVLFRSARLDDASERDRRRLAEELHISTVLDLRSMTEHEMATRKHRGEDALNPEQPSLPPTEANEHLMQIPGVQRSLISLTGRAFERALLWRLDWYNLIRVLALVASGYRTEAVTIVGQQVMAPRGLIGLGQDTLDSSTAEIREIFELLVSPAAYPVVVHCTQGKDRTGLIVLLLLLLVPEVSADAIAADYVKSEPELVVEFEERMREIRVLGLDEEYTKCPPGFTQQIRAHLDAKYGGVEGYLMSVGIDREKQELIRQRLLA
ncbi:tyrosine-protein phosphatase [Aspergillus udagawae]|uniref:Tyrosine-protein phosphatase n=1 Tax=Aspergillus udagawae TaxID=91492 RepID=A0ABQ1AXH4_9EURO|nr:tyrosine-protein phosphatase [Aspergillus udagawae]GFF89886.1 tyrosine-protein phosphatase [Aspergillus udagawae]